MESETLVLPFDTNHSVESFEEDLAMGASDEGGLSSSYKLLANTSQYTEGELWPKLSHENLVIQPKKDDILILTIET